jgi:hypothetical protein
MHVDDTELAAAYDLLDRLTSGSMSMRLNGKDITRYEITVFKREIASPEAVRARRRGLAAAASLMLVRPPS